MRRLWARLTSEQDGTIVIVVALMMTAILGLAALGTDVGRLFVERQRLSVVADAAALSGAQHLPDNKDKALETARSILVKNNIDLARARISVAEDKRSLNVDVERTVPLTFARLIGPDSEVVLGAATGETQNLSGYYGAAPLGVPRADWKIGDQVYLKLDADAGSISPGNYQALALGKSGASMYEQNLMTGYKDWIRIDQWVDTEPGNMAGPTIRAVNYRIDQDPYSTYTSYNRQSPRLVVVPILEDFNVNGKGQVHVVGFGMFFLEDTFESGNNRGQIVGRFVKMVAEGEGSLAAPDFGLRTTKLKN